MVEDAGGEGRPDGEGGSALAGTLDAGIPYPLPTSNSMPSQETAPARPTVP
jgi:hypothetical protein